VLLSYAAGVLMLAAYAPLTRAQWNSPRFLNGLRFLLVVAGVTAVVVGLGLLRARPHPVARLLGLVATGLLAFLVARYAVNVDDPAGRLREQTHLVQYGGFAALFVALYRRRLEDASVYGFAFLITLLLSLANEAVQWALPTRVGVLSDVKLDAASALVGLVFMLGAVDAWRPRRPIAARRLAGLLHVTALLVLALAAFVHRVHLGRPINDPQIGSFVSRYRPQELRELSGSWTPKPAVQGPRWRQVWQMEDFYAAEARHHVRLRDRRIDERKVLEALKEQSILETYYASYLAAHPDRNLNAEERSKLVQAAGENAAAYPYRGGPHNLVAWLPVPALWLAAGLLATILALVAEVIRLRG
jgi:VanZ family protein